MPSGRARALDRERIVRVAVELADEHGATGASLSAVAARLGVTPMALYRHVGDKDGLIDLMLDAAEAEIAPTATPDADWRAALHGQLMAEWEMTARHPWYAELVHLRPPAGPHQRRRIEFVLGVLTEQGASLAEAMTCLALLHQHVIGGALQRATESAARRRQGLEEWDRFVAAMEPIRELAAADETTPLLAQWLDRPSGASDDERFELGLGWLLDGIAAQLDRPVTTPRTGRSTRPGNRPVNRPE